MKFPHASRHVKYKSCIYIVRGFTVAELLVVTGMMTVLIGVGLFMSIDAYKKYVFRAEQHLVVSVLEKARSRAINNIHQSPHGVCFQESKYVIFRGVCIADNPTNEYIAANKLIARHSRFETLFPVIFFTQITATTTPVVIQVKDGVRVADISVNYEGTISW